MTQSAGDVDITLVWQQIVEARRLWQHTVLEEALCQFFRPWLQRVELSLDCREIELVTHRPFFTALWDGLGLQWSGLVNT